MKIMNVMQCTNLGGMERSSLVQMLGLKSRGHVVTVLSLNPLGALGPLLEEADIPATGLPYKGRGGWRSHRSVRQELRTAGADIVIMTGHHFLTTFAIKQTIARKKILAIHFHHRGVKRPTVWRAFYRFASSTFDHISFPSDFVRREAEALCPRVARIAVTVRNPIEVKERAPEARRRRARYALGIPEGAKVIGNAGWLIPRKRFDVFLEASKLVAARRRDTIFVIGGDGPERERLQHLAREIGIEDLVRWTGWLSNMDDFYASLDVCLFNSDFDAFPTTPLEAMACGVPVVASLLQGGLDEVITGPDVGVLLRAHDVQALAGHVLTALEQRSGYGGQARIRQMCDPERCISEFERLVTP